MLLCINISRLSFIFRNKKYDLSAASLYCQYIIAHELIVKVLRELYQGINPFIAAVMSF